MSKKQVEGCVLVGRQLGQGSHATVWEFAEKGALKVIRGKVKSKSETRMIQSAVRHELYIHRHVKGIDEIAPALRSYWKCNGLHFFLFPRYLGDLKALGEQQLGTSKFTEEPQAVLFTETQLLDMFQLAKRLGREFRVLHGDLRMEQYFYNTDGIVVGDFGFAGYYPRNGRRRFAQWGWLLCPQCDDGDDVNLKLPPAGADIERYLASFNQFQLLADLTANGIRTYVRCGHGQIKVLAPNKQLSAEFSGSQQMQYVPLPRGVARYYIPSQYL